MTAEPDRLRRRRTHGAGLRAERIAVLWLAAKGYRILARRFAVHGGELDIVARRGDTLAFVEVKSRASLEAASVAVTPGKLRRINRAAAVWLSRNPQCQALVIRGDLVVIAPWRLPRHRPDALPIRFPGEHSLT